MLKDLKEILFSSWLNVLLLFVPVSFILERTHAPAVWVFAAAGLAIIPLAGLIGHATETATEHTGPGVGGLLNATFGNATELIIALFAIHRGLFAVVKASITGSILGNILLVLGLSMFVGGVGREQQTFNATAASSGSSMLMVAVTALILPALWELVVYGTIGPTGPRVQLLSDLTSGVLMGTYFASLVFALITHRELFAVTDTDVAAPPRYPMATAVTLLLLATGVTAFEAEVLVGAIESVARTVGLTELFIGVIIVAVVGNAAEHFTAVIAARRNQMDLAINIAIGSSTQIALFVAPILVLASHVLSAQPMDLVFNPFEIVAVTLSVMIVAMVCRDGESNWFEGIQLIAFYLMIAIAFYLLPALPHH